MWPIFDRRPRLDRDSPRRTNGHAALYLRRDGDDLSLAVEHRAAASSKPMRIELVQRGDALALEVVDQPATMMPALTSLDERIMAVLADAARPLPFAKMRARCRVRAATLYQRIAALAAEGRIIKTDDGYRLAG